MSGLSPSSPTNTERARGSRAVAAAAIAAAGCSAGWFVGKGSGLEHRAKAVFTLVCYSTAKSMFPFSTPASPCHRLEGVGKRGAQRLKQGESERRASYSGRTGSWRRPPASPTPLCPQIVRYELRTIATLGEALAA